MIKCGILTRLVQLINSLSHPNFFPLEQLQFAIINVQSLSQRNYLTLSLFYYPSHFYYFFNPPFYSLSQYFSLLLIAPFRCHSSGCIAPKIKETCTL